LTSNSNAGAGLFFLNRNHGQAPEPVMLKTNLKIDAQVKEVSEKAAGLLASRSVGGLLFFPNSLYKIFKSFYAGTSIQKSKQYQKCLKLYMCRYWQCCGSEFVLSDSDPQIFFLDSVSDSDPYTNILAQIFFKWCLSLRSYMPWNL
jgi:hypothetical protein